MALPAGLNQSEYLSYLEARITAIETILSQTLPGFAIDIKEMPLKEINSSTLSEATKTKLKNDLQDRQDKNDNKKKKDK